jgi:hypothetical protein
MKILESTEKREDMKEECFKASFKEDFVEEKNLSRKK